MQTIIQESHAENQRRHEEKVSKINSIANSELGDSYVQQLILDKFLAPVEEAQRQMQEAAKHAQYMAEVINYHNEDRNLTKSQAKEVCQQFRYIAIQLSQINSLYDLQLLYKAITIFCHRMADFQHRDRNYSIEKEVREGILERLNACIAIENNFQRRLSLMDCHQNNERNSKSLISGF